MSSSILTQLFRCQLVKHPHRVQLRCLSKEASTKLASLQKDWNVDINKSDDELGYLVRVNSVILKTPMKNLLKVYDETLALGIANEFKCQSEGKKLNLQKMHLTTLAYEAIDNPFNESNDVVTQSIIEYLKFDTVRFRDVDNEGLLQRQNRHWDPMVGWFEHTFDCHIPIDYGSLTETTSLPEQTIKKLTSDLDSHKRWPLIGFRFMVQNLKSFILAKSLARRFLSVDQAVDLARLEVEYQTEKWSKVEWEHDLEEQTTKARVAAGSLFYHLTL